MNRLIPLALILALAACASTPKASFQKVSLEVLVRWHNKMHPDKPIHIADVIKADRFTGNIDLNDPERLPRMLSHDPKYKVTACANGFLITAR